MRTILEFRGVRLAFGLSLAAAWCGTLRANSQTLLNVDFGVGASSRQVGFAGTGQGTNDVWNLYTHYPSRFQPGFPLVADGRLAGLKLADGSPSSITLSVTNAPGVWGNATGDPMLDSYVFAPNGSNILVSLSGIPVGRYHFYLYGWAAADGAREQASAFVLRTGTHRQGPLSASGAGSWQVGQPWREGAQFVVFRDVPVEEDKPVLIEIMAGSAGVAVLNGLQMLSRGTSPPLLAAPLVTVAEMPTNILFRSIHYEGRLAGKSARFTVSVEAESRSTNEISVPLFAGDVALLDPKLPSGWRIVKRGPQFTLHAVSPGHHRLELEILARVTREEPWNVVRFIGPPAAIASVSAEATEPNIEVQLMSGTLEEAGVTDPGRVRGVLGLDRELALRWQSKTAEARREALVTVDSRSSVRLTPVGIRYTTSFRYDISQSRLAQVRIAVPAGQAITKLTGDAVRDWRVAAAAEGEVLTVDLIRPVEGEMTLSLATDEALPALPGTAVIRSLQPLDVQREAGEIRLQAEDLAARVEGSDGLRQVNALAGEFAAFRFNARPASLRLALASIEPAVTVSSRVRAHLEEGRLLIGHDLTLDVSRAGLYALDLQPPPGFLVSGVEGEGIEDWKLADGVLRIGLAQRLSGKGKLAVQLEQSLQALPPELPLGPLRLAGATRESAFVGVGSSPGIQLKTVSVTGAREIPITALPDLRDESLAYRADSGDWSVTVAAERLAPRVVAEVFNLVTIGNGLVGGSATVRFGIMNQGVQQLRLRLPAHWRNVEFTGPHIRRRDQQDDVWTVSLQDKVWGGYTLVVTYDYAFDPIKAALDAAGAHPLDVERETGTVAITSAANLALDPGPTTEPLRRMDPSELALTDRALVSRPVLLAYRYEGGSYALRLNLTRHEELSVLDAVADRAQLTSVLTGTGEMLSQASFMVKNNERQYQRFELPAGATLWGATVNGDPVRADRDGSGVLVALPRGENRDELFAIDIKYAQQVGALGRLWPKRLELIAPNTDVPGTYVEWMLYVPVSRHVSGFGGNMTVAYGTAYGWRDGWASFVNFYRGLWHDFGPGLVIAACIAGFVVALTAYGKKRGASGVAGVVVAFFVLVILAGMMLPALSKAKAKAQRINSANNLKQIGLAARMYATDNDGQMPNSFEDMMVELGTPKVFTDPETGQRYTYIGAGKSEADPDAILAYSPERSGGNREVVFADGSVHVLAAARFAEALVKDQATVGALQPAAGVAQLPGSPPHRAPAVADQPTPSAASQPPPSGPASLPGSSPGAAPVTASGIKSLKFDLPRSGRAYTFTRVLSLNNEPPTISVRLMSGRAFVFLRATAQLAAFLAGLILVIYQWRRVQPRSVWLAAGIVLAGLATVDLLIAWRMLGLVLIVAVPGFLVVGAAGLFWRWRSRGRGQTARLSSPPTVDIPPAVAGLVLFLATLSCDALGASPATPRPSPVSVVSAVYTGSAHEQSAQFDATLTLASSTTNQSVTLFGQEVAVQEFTAISGEAEVHLDGQGVGIRLPNAGEVSVGFRFLVRLGGDVGQRRLEFGVPPALGSRLTLTVMEPEAEVEFPEAVSLERELQQETTVVRAVLGTVDRVVLSWTPKRKRTADLAATVFAQQATLVTLGDGVVNTRARLDWQVSQGEVQRVRVRLPKGQRLLKVTGDQVRSWEFAETNRDVLSIEFVKPLSPAIRLEIETEKPLEALPADVAVLLPEPLDVKRQSGWVAARATEELGLTLERGAGLERIDSAEFAQAIGEPSLAVFSAWRFVRHDFDLQLRADLLQPRIEAIQRQHFTIGPDQLGLATRVEYRISRSGVFALRLVLPPEGRIESVNCQAMQSWTEQGAGSRRFLEVALKERTLGEVTLEVSLQQTYTNLAATIALAGVHPLEVEKLTGYITVAAEAGVGLKTSAIQGVTEIPVAAVSDPASSAPGTLAFKQVATEPQAEAAWRVQLATEQLEPWLRAEIVHVVTIGENLLTGRAQVRYEIQNAPVKEFRFRVPESWRSVEILGAGVRRRDHADGEWRVGLQNKVSDDYRLMVQWEMPLGGSNSFSLSGVQALGVEREAGAIALHTRGQLQLVAGQPSDQLVRIDPRELPEWAVRDAPSTPDLSFRYLRPGWQLPIEVRRLENAAVLEALVDDARLRTVIAEDGQQMTQLELRIRNNGRQNVALILPPGTEVWSAFVDGRPVRPTRRGDALLLPLEGSENSDAPTPIELVYVGRVKFPRTSGTVELVSPRVDLPLKEARWEVFLPTDFAYSRFKGTMTYESAELVSVSQEFTFAEYQRQEISKQESVTSQAMDLLRRTRVEMSTGNLAGASKLKGLQSARLRDGATAEQLRRLEADVNRAKGSQLIEAQRAYTLSNLGQIEAGAPERGAPMMDARMMQRYGLVPRESARREVPGEAGVAYDAHVAEQQVTQLQKAQAVAETVVAPLRANLPTRGLRYSFVQVLQTETDKPLVVRLHAKNERITGWFERFVFWGGGFLALWIAAAVTLSFRPPRTLSSQAPG